MFPGAFTRGNSVAFSFGEARWYTADGAPVAWSLTIISDTHRHLSSRAPSIWLSRRILPLRCNSEHTLPPWKNTTPNSSHLSLRSTFDLRSFDFYGLRSPPPFLFKVEGVQAVLCGDRENHQRPARYRRIGTNSTLWHKKAAKWDHIDTV